MVYPLSVAGRGGRGGLGRQAMLRPPVTATVPARKAASPSDDGTDRSDTADESSDDPMEGAGSTQPSPVANAAHASAALSALLVDDDDSNDTPVQTPATQQHPRDSLADTPSAKRAQIGDAASATTTMAAPEPPVCATTYIVADCSSLVAVNAHLQALQSMCITQCVSARDVRSFLPQLPVSQFSDAAPFAMRLSICHVPASTLCMTTSTGRAEMPYVQPPLRYAHYATLQGAYICAFLAQYSAPQNVCPGAVFRVGTELPPVIRDGLRLGAGWNAPHILLVNRAQLAEGGVEVVVVVFQAQTMSAASLLAAVAGNHLQHAAAASSSWIARSLGLASDDADRVNDTESDARIQALCTRHVYVALSHDMFRDYHGLTLDAVTSTV